MLEALEATELLVCLVFFPAMPLTSFREHIVTRKFATNKYKTAKTESL
jgi:hypothetical protein